MRKIRLQLDALAVESFDTSPGARRRPGTVKGHVDAVTAPEPQTDWDSCWGTCENGETCCTPGCDTNVDTCWDTCGNTCTCPMTCLDSCGKTCPDTCTRMWTECPTGYPNCCV